jgi:hypothetical protein
LCSRTAPGTVARSVCQVTNWATRSPLAYKAGTLAAVQDPLVRLLSTQARWAGCGSNYGVCAAALGVASQEARGASNAAALFTSFGTGPVVGVGPDGGPLVAGVLMEVCPPSPRTSLFNVSRVLAKALPGGSRTRGLDH